VSEVLWKYRGKIDLQVTVPDVLKDRWERHIKAERERILNSILTSIATGDDFREKLVLPSSDRYSEFVFDGFPLAEEIETRQLARLSRSYGIYDSKVREAFADEAAPGAFLKAIPEGKVKFGEAKYTLMGLGEGRILNFRAVAKAVMFLFGYSAMYRYLQPELDTFIGWENYCSPISLKFRRIGRPAMLTLLIQGLVVSIYCTELPKELYPEWRYYRDLTINIANNYVERMLQPMLNIKNGIIYCGQTPVSEVSLRLEVVDEAFYAVAEVVS